MEEYIIGNKKYNYSEYEELLNECCDGSADINGKGCIGDCKKCLENYVKEGR